MSKLNPNILTDPLGGISSQFGVPSCILNLTKELLGLLPGNILGGMSIGVDEGMARAQNGIASVTRSIFRDLGIIEFDSETGLLTFLSETSQWGVDGTGSSLLGGFENFLGILGGMGAAYWKNRQVLLEQIAEIENCLGDYSDWLDGVENKSNIQSPQELAATPGKLEVFKLQVLTCTDYIKKGIALQTTINEIFLERQENPSTIPIFLGEDVDEEVEDPIFRLTFGPPLAKAGRFILSVDGLYYDSQTREYEGDQDVPTELDLKFIPNEDKWMLDHAPNLGGRGSSYGLKDLDTYVDTFFDVSQIDESVGMQTYYDADHMVQFIISQKNKKVNDIQGNLQDLRASGYTVDSAMYLNFQQQVHTENARFNEKINKRKKQIEVAIKSTDLFGLPAMFSPGSVPINDFSYLSSINLDVELQKQKGLVFDHGEISGVVLPIVPKFVHADESTQRIVVTPLNVTPIGAGSIIDGEELEGGTPILSLTTGITTDNLIAVYNFTDVNLEKPNSNVFNTLNCNALGTEYRAQTVTNNPSLLFQQGLGIPYLTGIPVRNKIDSDNEFKNETWADHEFEISDSGNYVRLPDGEDYQNLMYTTEGATLDFWTHVPGLYQQEDGWWKHPFETSSFGFALSSGGGKWCDGHYYRVLLGCDNTGGIDGNIDSSSIIIDESTNNVNGMVMGISRDPRMYYEGSAVSPGATDFNPRQNFGAILEGVDTLASAVHSYASSDSGIWTLSSSPTSALPVAFEQASGTFDISGPINNLVFTVTSVGDGYTGSSNDACCVLFTSGVGLTPSGVSGTLDVPYFSTGSDHTLNIGTPSTVFFIAPTRSYNTSSVGFARDITCNDALGDILKFVVSDKATVGGVSLSDCVTKFINISVVFDPPNDKLKFYINSNLIKEDSLSRVFGRSPKDPPRVPSFIFPRESSLSSFEYTSGTVSQKDGVSLFDEGPKNNTFFTPWILGGGWTDGRDINLNTSSGGFLDTGTGIMSSYNGYVGSMKIYKKALNNKEIVKNYVNQKTFFENIDL